MSLKEYTYFNKKKIIILIGGLVGCVLIFLFYFYDSNTKEESVLPIVLDKNDEVLEEVSSLCYFDIKGEVKKPGVYFIECDKRVNDAIILSGGLTKNSDPSVLNLSKKIEDGMVIKVYSKKEVSNYLETLDKENKKEGICSSSNIKNDACISNSNISNSSKININTATLNQLMTLTGIGESKAKNIISYRENNPFKSIEDILNVDGIGESIYVNIKESITV